MGRSMAWSVGTVTLTSMIIVFFSLPLSCISDDTLIAGESITSNRTLISADQSFAMGFFSPGNRTNRRYYVGIWYNQVPNRTLLWVANRNKPVADSAGVLALSSAGNLMILAGGQIPVWSTNTTSSRNTSAVLLDSGNLVLRDDRGAVLWQSFDYPTDTYIPGMRLRLNLKNLKTQRFVSWRSEDDPSPGPFSFGIDPLTPLQLVIWNGSERIWRSGRWTGDIYGGNLPTNQSYISYLTVVANETEISFTISVSETITSRIVMSGLGRVLQLSWVPSSRKWIEAWRQPEIPCEFYSRCGPSGVCDHNGPPSLCHCLKGYQPKSQKDWEMGEYTGGCVRGRAQECEKGDGFYRMEKIKVPDLSTVVRNVTLIECRARCLENCSCSAFAIDDLTRVGCLLWSGELQDVVENYATGLDFYVRVPKSQLAGAGSGSNKKKILLAILLPIAVGLILVSGMFACLLRRRVQKQGEASKGLFLQDVAFGKTQIDLADSSTIGEGERGPHLPLFSFASVVAATDKFSEANKLGHGGFGPVYKGSLLDGQEVAVKRLSQKSGQGLEEFRNELLVIAKLQHRNLVRLLGWCVHEEEKLLIYEYMPNKSLDKHLFDPARRSQLDWGIRFRIIEGIAQGILYLHKFSRLRIIHRDLKAGNILLDEALNPKISDFGMARIFGGNQTTANTQRVVGTYGYMSPEYALEGQFSEKSDVYSFGVLLLETVSGRKNTGFYQNGTTNLLAQAWGIWKEGRSFDLMDESIKDSKVKVQVERCVHVGLLCIQEDPGDRPTMASVVLMLADERMNLPLPSQSTFPYTRVCDSSSTGGTECSVNEMTLSSMVPR